MHRSVVQVILCQLSVKFLVSPDNMTCFNCCPRHFMPHFSSFTQFPRSNTKAHSKTQIEQHLNLALRSLETTQRLVKDQSQQIELLMAKNKDTSQQIEQLMAKDKDTSQQIERLTAQVKVQDQHIRSLNSPLFVWKIYNFTRAYRRAASGIEKIITNTFYLSSNGYRLRIKIFLKAIQASNHNFLLGGSLFCICICVVPGEFDPLLSWPFKEKVRVTLINQNPYKDEEKNICRVTDFGSLDMPIRRPLNEDNESWHVVLEPYFDSVSFMLRDTLVITVQKE